MIDTVPAAVLHTATLLFQNATPLVPEPVATVVTTADVVAFIIVTLLEFVFHTYIIGARVVKQTSIQ